MELGLNGKIALVCAASRGLGYAVAERLAREKARVAIVARDEEALNEAAAKLVKETGGGILPLRGDVTNDADMQAAFAALRARWGSPDILIANAGGPAPGRFEALSDEDWLNAFNLSLMSSVRLIRRVLPVMQERRQGAILLMTSVSVRQPIPSLMLSNAIRAATTNMAKTLADEVATDGVRVNVLAPGYFRTARMERVLTAQAERRGVDFDTQLADLTSAIPLKRMGEPREFGDLAAFLVSERASYITGGHFLIDGGFYRGV